MKAEEFPKGEVVFGYGDAPDKFFIILKGRVGVEIPLVLKANLMPNTASNGESGE
jgi:hypothetical protein